MIASEHSINAKLLYGLLLNRTMLSQKSGWVSEVGNVYVIYTIKQMADGLNRSEKTVKTALNELENAGLITRVRQGWNRANRIFLHLPDGVQLSSPPEGNICPMEVQEGSSPIMGAALPVFLIADFLLSRSSRFGFGTLDNAIRKVGVFVSVEINK